MKNSFKLLTTIILALVITGCQGKPVGKSNTNNPEFNVEELFTHKGCTVYRFFDRAVYIYYVDCSNADSQVMWQQHCGKNCNRPYAVRTIKQVPTKTI